MTLTRRFLLSRSAAALCAAGLAPLMPLRGWALTSLERGDLRIDSLSDGHIEMPAELAFAAIPDGDRAALLDRLGADPNVQSVESPINVTLMRQGGLVVLFDAGSGPDFVPTAGRLTEALDALEVAPEDITHTVFTHGHPDHLWGLLDEFDEPLFPNAALKMGAAEFAYWTDPDTARTIGEERLSFAAGAMRRLSAVADVIETFDDGAEVLPGVRAVATPGHTPGHMSFAIGTPETGMFVIGDAVTSLIGFARPDIGAGTDHDPARAAATRAALLSRLATEGWDVLGYHLPGGGIGRVAADGDAFTFVQEP